MDRMTRIPCDRRAGTISRRAVLRTAGALAAAGSLRALLASTPAVLADEAGSPWQIGCYTRPWDKFDYRVALDGIAEAGYRYAGIMTAKGKSWVIITPETTPDEAAKIGEEVAKRGLKTISVYGDFAVTDSLAKGIAALRRLIDNCAACGARNLLLGGTGEPSLYDAYYKAVAESCDFAESRHVALSIKPHGGLNATGAQCRRAIERVGRRNFRLWYDPGNIYFYSDGKLDPVEDARQVDGLVTGMSVKDFRDPKEVLVTPGTGRVRFAEVLARLTAGGFKGGPIVVETLAPGDAANVTAQAVTARRFVEALVAGTSTKGRSGP